MSTPETPTQIDDFVDIGPLANFAEHSLTAVEVGRRKVVLARLAAGVFAIGGSCPHMGAQLCGGRLENRIDSTGSGDLSNSDEFVVACPWHSWEFDLKTGQAIADASTRLPTYDVRVADGRILIDPRPTRTKERTE